RFTSEFREIGAKDNEYATRAVANVAESICSGVSCSLGQNQANFSGEVLAKNCEAVSAITISYLLNLANTRGSPPHKNIYEHLAFLRDLK
ncbi:MAG: hypothetical protein AABY05_00530, partial [Nanoarchaeota archaeon]